MTRSVLLITILLLWPLAALAGDKDCNAACKALQEHSGSKPGSPTEQLVCLEYPAIPEGSLVWLQLRKIGADGKKLPLTVFETPRMKVAKDGVRTRFCYGKGYHRQADETYLCAEFPDKSQWHSTRRRKAFGGTGAYERAEATSPAVTTLKMCLGKECPARLPD